MEEAIKAIEEILQDDFEKSIKPEHGTEILILLSTFRKFKHKKLTAEKLKFNAQIVLDCTWEKLNMGRWIDVPVENKQVYAVAALVKIIACLEEGLTNQSQQDEIWKKALEVADLGILLGLPLGRLDLTKVADLLSKHVPKSSRSVEVIDANQSLDGNDWIKKLKLDNQLESISCPSLEFFHYNYFRRNKPVKLTDCMDHWPALKLWSNLGYIREKAGDRTVPIEIGKHYADESYSQKLMRISDFIEQYFAPNAENIGYLAQHQLFDQVPELKNDIHEPDYCALSDKYEEAAETDINAWFGPKGTVSPLHYDPKHNLLAQVVGTKKVILYPQEDSKFLYPHDSTLWFNTSQVDVENPDLSSFPDFRLAVRSECVLKPGEMLYIPPKYWHHVRALENSFSVSFWWE